MSATVSSLVVVCHGSNLLRGSGKSRHAPHPVQVCTRSLLLLAATFGW
jgi:hypothetical protein